MQKAGAGVIFHAQEVLPASDLERWAITELTKSGDEYQELVASVRRALDPRSDVTAGDWVVGPDGRRDKDVWVVGTANGVPERVLIECKDWNKRVGIGVVDALESKRRDLDATRSMIYSNSGFTKPAIKKAKRVGIQLAAALRAGDRRVRVAVSQDFVARRLSVEHWQFRHFWDRTHPDPGEFDARLLTFHGLFFVDWLERETLRLLQEHPTAPIIKLEISFVSPQTFSTPDRDIQLIGFVFAFYCSESWLTQIVPVDVSLGHVDIHSGRVVVPDKQMYEVGPFDPKRWVEREAPSESSPLAEGEFSLELTLVNPVAGSGRGQPPAIEDVILEMRVSTPDPATVA